jgi:hypothetical protein
MYTTQVKRLTAEILLSQTNLASFLRVFFFLKMMYELLVLCPYELTNEKAVL